jgi:hypothetical protein
MYVEFTDVLLDWNFTCSPFRDDHGNDKAQQQQQQLSLAASSSPAGSDVSIQTSAPSSPDTGGGMSLGDAEGVSATSTCPVGVT